MLLVRSEERTWEKELLSRDDTEVRADREKGCNGKGAEGQETPILFATHRTHGELQASQLRAL